MACVVSMILYTASCKVPGRSTAVWWHGGPQRVGLGLNECRLRMRTQCQVNRLLSDIGLK